jgi:high-affinity iron transporter
MLREGIEAALIVGIIASYLKQTGRGQWMPAVWIGVLLAGALALLVGGGLEMVSAEFPQKQQELFEGLVGLLAVVILTSMVFWMRKVARSVKDSLQASLEQALGNSNNQVFALIAMVFFAVAREGLETVFFLLAVFQQSEGSSGPIGALYKGSLRMNLNLFFRWTGLFILVVAAGVLANSVRSLHEAGLWNHFQTVLFDFSASLPMDGPTGSVLAGMFGYQDTPTVSVVTAYVVYLAVTLAIFFMPASRQSLVKTPSVSHS